MPSSNRSSFSGAWNITNNNNSLNESDYVMNNNQNNKMFLSRTVPSSPRCTPYNSRHNSPSSMPSSPISTSPTSSPPPISMLRRNYSSTFMLIPEDRAIDATNGVDHDKSTTSKMPLSKMLLKMILWWPLVLLNIGQKIFMSFMRMTWGQFLLAVPTFWLSAWLWILWKVASPPLAFIKWCLVALHTPSSERSRKKRTILISCGSTIQTLHMARNFYSAGARVVVFEFDGLFGLARFSTAVSKFYTVPRPTPDSSHDYVAALCDIVEKEKAAYYVPICATSAAHYDSLAKPHLELLGCTSFIPGTQEVSILDDILEVMKKCRFYGIPLPPHRVLTTKEDLFRLYEIGWLSGFRNIMISGGTTGILERHKFILPQARTDVKLTHEISDLKQWVVIRDLPGTHYVTCTTVKESNVIANVTCSIKAETRSLIPEENEEVENWVKNFFTKVRLQRPISGHFSLRLVKCEQSGNLVPIGIRVGVSLPYICHTGVHSRVLWKPCPHFSRQNSGPIVQDGGRYWIHEALINTFKHPSVNSVGKLIGTVLDKREALFVYWDPLPYLAYYHFQLPFKSVKMFLHKQQSSRSMTNTLAAPVH